MIIRKALSVIFVLLLSCLFMQSALASGSSIFSMPDPSFTQNPNTSVGVLSAIYGNAVTSWVGGSTTSGSTLFVEMLHHFDAILATSTAIFSVLWIAYLTLHSSEEGVFLGSKHEKGGLLFRCISGPLMLVPGPNPYSIAFIQKFIMWLILIGVHLANYVWTLSLSDISAGVTPLQPASMRQSLAQTYGEYKAWNKVTTELTQNNRLFSKADTGVTVTTHGSVLYPLSDFNNLESPFMLPKIDSGADRTQLKDTDWKLGSMDINADCDTGTFAGPSGECLDSKSWGLEQFTVTPQEMPNHPLLHEVFSLDGAKKWILGKVLQPTSHVLWRQCDPYKEQSGGNFFYFGKKVRIYKPLPDGPGKNIRIYAIYPLNQRDDYWHLQGCQDSNPPPSPTDTIDTLNSYFNGVALNSGQQHEVFNFSSDTKDKTTVYNETQDSGGTDTDKGKGNITLESLYSLLPYMSEPGCLKNIRYSSPLDVTGATTSIKGVHAYPTDVANTFFADLGGAVGLDTRQGQDNTLGKAYNISPYINTHAFANGLMLPNRYSSIKFCPNGGACGTYSVSFAGSCAGIGRIGMGVVTDRQTDPIKYIKKARVKTTLNMKVSADVLKQINSLNTNTGVLKAENNPGLSDFETFLTTSFSGVSASQSKANLQGDTVPGTGAYPTDGNGFLVNNSGEEIVPSSWCEAIKNNPFGDDNAQDAPPKLTNEFLGYY